MRQVCQKEKVDVKSLLFLSLIFSTGAFATELAGKWRNTTDGSIISFLSVNQSVYQYSSQKFTYPNGSVAYTIDQAVTLPSTGEDKLEGTVDFYDSRGCSFKDLPVIVEFQDARTVNVLMTVPRYKFQTITTGEPYYRPRYCQGPYGTYICGSTRVNPSVSHSCRVLEYVDVPVELKKL